MKGLRRRGAVGWIEMVFRSRRIRKSLNTWDKRLAEKIYHKIKTQVIEGHWFEAPKGSDKTFEDLMERGSIITI